MVCITRQAGLQGNPTLERVEGQFNGYRSGAGTESSAGSGEAPRDFRSAVDAGCRRSGRERDPRERAPHDRRRVFSGVINILMLSGSLYMLQVYDRVIPSRNLATLFGLSLMVLIAYLVQGYFDAMRSRMLCRIATLFDGGLQGSIHSALATLPLRGVKPVLMQQPLRDLDQVRTFMSGMGPTAFLDMPWIPVFLIGLFLFHPLMASRRCWVPRRSLP